MRCEFQQIGVVETISNESRYCRCAPQVGGCLTPFLEKDGFSRYPEPFMYTVIVLNISDACGRVRIALVFAGVYTRLLGLTDLCATQVLGICIPKNVVQ